MIAAAFDAARRARRLALRAHLRRRAQKSATRNGTSDVIVALYERHDRKSPLLQRAARSPNRARNLMRSALAASANLQAAAAAIERAIFPQSAKTMNAMRRRRHALGGSRSNILAHSPPPARGGYSSARLTSGDGGGAMSGRRLFFVKPPANGRRPPPADDLEIALKSQTRQRNLAAN